MEAVAAVGSTLMSAGSTAASLAGPMQMASSAASMISDLAGAGAARQDGANAAATAALSAELSLAETQFGSDQAMLDANQVDLVARYSSNVMRENLLNVLGGQSVAFLAAGVSANSGSAEFAEGEARRDTAFDQKLLKSNARLERLRHLMRASSIRRTGMQDAYSIRRGGQAAVAKGNASASQSLVQAISTGADLMQSIGNRGGPAATTTGWGATVTPA